MDSYKNACNALEKELEKATRLVYPAMAITLLEMGWSYKRLDTTCVGMSEVLDDLSKSDKSCIQMCDEEVGIELMCEDSDKHWYELTYLSQKNWEEYLEKHNNKVCRGYLIAVKNAQKKWCIPQMYATVFTALNRKYNFSYEWMCQLYERMNEVIHEVEFDTKRMDIMLAEKTSLRFLYGAEIKFERIKNGKKGV